MIRFIELEDMSLIPSLIQQCSEDQETKNFKPGRIQMISIANEKRVLSHLYRLAEEGLAKYETTLEEDLEFLKQEDLTFNIQNCVLMRSGEKTILKWWIEFVSNVLPLMDLSHKEIKHALSRNANLKKYDVYLKEVISVVVRQVT
jgi:hypothetical protein